MAEHDGNLVRFHPFFLAFAREFGFYPRAYPLTAAWENAKIQWVKYTARGFRNKRNFATAILFHCGGLDLVP